MTTTQSLSEHAALKLWEGVKRDLPKNIITAIRKMKLPVPKTDSPKDGMVRLQRRGQLRLQRYGEVKAALLHDIQLQDDVLLDTAEQFWSGVRAGKFSHDSTPGIIVCIAKRSARRLATKRAKLMLTELTHCEGASVFNDVSTTGPLKAPELALDDLRNWKRLLPHLRNLTPEDLLVLVAKIESSVDKRAYDELAAELGTTIGALRTRAHRICRRLREKLQAERQREEGPYDRIKKEGVG